MSLTDIFIGSNTYITTINGITGAKYEVALGSAQLSDLDDGDTITFDDLEPQQQYDVTISRTYRNITRILVHKEQEETLSLAEVQAFTYDGENVALGGTATQSSDGWDAYAPRAIDGNTSGVWGHGSVTHTASDDTGVKWWNLAITPAPVTTVVIYNRTNCCWDRLAGSILRVYDEDGNLVLEETLTGDVLPQTFTIV